MMNSVRMQSWNSAMTMMKMATKMERKVQWEGPEREKVARERTSALRAV